MITKNLTELLLATRPCSTRARRLEMSLVARGTYVLDPARELVSFEGLDRGFLSAEGFAEDDPERAGELTYPGDFAEVKLNAEVMLRGACYPPGGKPVATCPVRFAVGAWSKSLWVYGTRFWTEGLTSSITEPKPFTSMPLRYANAFGGPGYTMNPVGKGLGTTEAPNVVAPSQPLTQRGDRPAPASFGPLHPGWEPRASRAGKQYDRRWLDTRSPYPSEDHDWRVLHAAPPDQQLPKYLQGDETLEFQNLHPEVPKFSKRLPGLRVRAFVNDKEQRFREVPMVLDTVFADLQEGKLYLTWRGLDEVRTDDLTEVTSVLLVHEPLASERSDPAQYRAALLAFEADPVGLKDAFPPEMAALEAHQKLLAEGKLPPPDPSLDPLTAEVKRRMGPAATEANLAPIVLLAAGLSRPEAKDSHAAVLAAMKNAPIPEEAPPVASLHKPGHLPDPGLRKQMRAMLTQAGALRAEFAKVPEEQRDPRLEASVRQLEAIPHNPRWKQLNPDYEPPGPLSPDAPGPGRNLVDHDFTGRDLSGVDLSGADLSHATLVRTKLRGANLRGAKLRGAVLFRADLTEADLQGADLTRCNAAKVFAPGADLRGATVELGFFEHAVLTGAKLAGARGEYAYFVGAKLEDADLRGAVLENAEFSEAALSRACLADAELRSGRFLRTVGRGADFSRAKLTGCSFQHASLERANFSEARGTGSFWSDAVLDEADCKHVWLVGAHFTGASAVRADFTAANLKDSRWDRATIEHASFVDANLLRVNLCRAKMSHARFTRANLYQAQFFQSVGTKCDFLDANLKRSTLDRWM